MTIVTIYALFGDDIRMLSFAKTADDTFYILTIIAMSLFILEIILGSIAKEDYFLGFYFWLDLIASLSLIFDIGWFWNVILGTDEGSANNA